MRNTRNRRFAGWRIGLAGSLAAHVVVLAGLAAIGRRALTDAAAATDAAASAIAVTPFEMRDAADRAELGDPPLAADFAPVSRPWDAPAGDRDNPVEVTIAPNDDDGRLRVAPAPDQGESGGQPADHAYRRDRTTLRQRLTDGGDAQPAQLRTSRRPASPQAIRREPTVGIGDAARTRLPSRTPGPKTPRAAQVLALGGEPGGATELDATAARAEPPIPAARISALPAPDHTVGPLDAEAGARSFDVERFGRAADDQTLRAASSEHHPGLTDFSRAAAPAATRAVDGRGPGTAPGAVPRPSAGSAPASFGARDPKAAGPDVSERTLDRRYDRYKLEIRQRVNNVLEFPKSLALRLEQGETIVEFSVGVDGRLGDGPRVVKSSGFEEFDSAALRAVRRAAPFPAMTNQGSASPLRVSMPVVFDNPVIR